jgi:NAD(P)-dependent dehydrogenase (short-subunit alcohol dehydrogenase family)
MTQATGREISAASPRLKGKVALVAGATRGAGRGIAIALGESGAIVYCSGRSTRRHKRRRAQSRDLKNGIPNIYAGRPETIEETAEMVTARGGKGIAAVTDHLEAKEVEKLIARIQAEQGQLHILVNDISEGGLHEFGKAFWQADIERGLAALRNGIHTHIITNRYAAPLMIETAKASGATGLIVEVGDGDSFTYRGNLFFDLVKTTVIRLAFAMGWELRRKNVAAVAITPGFLRSEMMLEHFGVTEANWRDAGKKDPNYLESETPLYVGRAIAALAADKNLMKKSCRAFSSWGLSEEYEFSDVDGRRPHWGRHAEKKYGDVMKPCDEGFYKYWFGGVVEQLFANWP